jgi:cytochrome P450
LSAVDDPRPAAPVPPAAWPSRRDRLLHPLRVANSIAVYPREAYEAPLLVRHFGGRQWLLVNDPAGVRHVLQANAGNYLRPAKQRRLLEPLMGQSLLTTDGAAWQRLRRLSAPAFRPALLEGFVPGFVAATEALAEEWRARPAGRPLDMAQAMTRLTLTIIAETLFGLPGRRLDAVTRAHHRYGLASAAIEGLVLLGLPVEAGGRLARQAARLTTAPLRRAIAEMAGAAAGRGLLGLLEEAQREQTHRGLTPAERHDHLVTLLLAGHVTTAMALSWLLYLLDLHPAVRSGIEAELAAALGDRQASAADLPRLPRLSAAIDETLRLYPSVPVLGRLARADDEVSGVPVPAGSHVAIVPWLLHRHLRLWPRPDRFAPDRFAPGAPAIDRNAYIPFGAGPRVCIGAGLATLEIAAVAATLLRRFRPRLAPGRAVVPAALGHLRPRGGLWMTVEPA